MPVTDGPKPLPSETSLLATCLLLGTGFLVLFAAAPPARGQIQVTPDSQLETEAGAEISYERFLGLAVSDRWVPEPIRDGRGEVIGYRSTGQSQTDSASARRELTGAIRGLGSGLEVLLEEARGRLLVPVTLHGAGGSREVSLMLDTGTLVPVMWLPEVREAVGTLDSVSLGALTIDRPVTGSYQWADALRRSGQRVREAAEHLGDRPVAGVMGWTLLSKLLVSIDVPAGRLVIRPPTSQRKTLYPGEPVAATGYRSEAHSIWIPARVDGEEGYVHLDTGYSYTWIQKGRVAGPADSLMVGGVNLLPHVPGAELRPVDQSEAYRRVPLDVVANLGVDALSKLVVTIDGPGERIYFESRPGGGI